MPTPQSTPSQLSPRLEFHRHLIGALWVAAGAVTIGLAELAQVLGRTGERLYAREGFALGLGALLVLAGLALMLLGRRWFGPSIR